MILIIDNYDSFTYNLVQYVGEVDKRGRRIEVRRNDAVSIAEIRSLAPSHLIISPGPCTPNESGISLDVLRELKAELPILGVCLGHQAIGQVFGGKVVRAAVPTHGKTSPIEHTGEGVMRGLPNPFIATRYHSLLVERSTLPECLTVTAWNAQGEIMGLRHKDFPRVEGVQFHPESIMTRCGRQLLANFLDAPAPTSPFSSPDSLS